MSLAQRYTFGMGVQRLHEPMSRFHGSAMGVSMPEAWVTSTYDTWDSAVLTHGPSGRQFLVRWERYYGHRGICDRITSLAEFSASGIGVNGIDLDVPVLASWAEAAYRNPDELLTACEDMVRLIVSGDAV